ncbi:MAG: restriction endonuclease subunit S, partial [Caldilineales bacterium]
MQPGNHDPNGVPILRVNNIRDGRIDVADVRRVRPAIAQKYQRANLRGREVLLTVVGTIGETVVVPINMAGWNIARAIAVIPVLGEVSSEWVRLCLQSADLQGMMRDWCNTTVQPTLNLADVAKLPIPIPPREIRERVVKVMSRLDDKIEINRRINRTLERMAQALYKYWFVDFGPFQDGEFVKSELGLVPKGWKVKALDEIATFTNGLALQKYLPTGDEYLPVIKIAEMRRGFTESSGKASPNIDTRFIVDDGDVLFSWSGTLLVMLWCGGRGALNQHLFRVTSDQYPKWLYYWATQHYLDEFRQIAANK